MKQVTATVTLVCGCDRSKTWTVEDDTSGDIISEQAEQFAVDQAAQYTVTWCYSDSEPHPCLMTA